MRIAVLLPVWNRVSTLARAIESALARYPDEVVVVDDASTDGSAELAESYGPPVRVVRHPRKTEDHIRAMGPVVESIDADYIVGMGADDVIYEGFLANVRDATDQRKSRGWPGVVFGDYALLREGDPLEVNEVRSFGMPGVVAMNPAEARAWFLRTPATRHECGVGSAIRRDLLVWLHNEEWWRLGPRSDALGYVVAALRAGCIYVPAIHGGLTVVQERPTYHQQVLSCPERRASIHEAARLWFGRPAILSCAEGVEFAV